MKNNYFFFFLFLFFIIFNNSLLNEKELNISSEKIKIDKISQITTFEGSVLAVDEFNNKVYADTAIYNKLSKVLKTVGSTKIITSEGYILESDNILFDNIKKVISSKENTKLLDKDGNQIFLSMFNYLINKNLLLSKGEIEIIDIRNNKYFLYEFYLNEKEKKIVGSDVRFFFEDEENLTDERNDPRIFANSVSVKDGNSVLTKGICTYCEDRGEKSPPWSIKAKEIKHNSAKKTIYYERAILKIYNFPIFYYPKLSHPDSTVSRRSGLLVPTYASNANTGSGISIPYFWAISKDKDLTFTPKIFAGKAPLLLSEYRQDFDKSYLVVGAGYTSSRSYIFSRFNTELIKEETKESNFQINLQNVSNDTFLKKYDINTFLVDSKKNILENSINFNYLEDDTFFGASFTAFEDLSLTNNSKYEYLLPDITFDKNLLADEKLGLLNFSSNLKVRSYDTNKLTQFFINDFDWRSNKLISKNGINSQFLSTIKTVNYNAKNTAEFKTDKTSSEVSGAIGYLAQIGFFKNNYKSKKNHLIQPKLLLKYAPNHMRKVKNASSLNYDNIFNLDRVNATDVTETGLSASLGFEYKKRLLTKDNIPGDEQFFFRFGQIISEEENNEIPSRTSLDQRFSDVVGRSYLMVNDNIDLNYNFSIDQSYKRFNYNSIGTTFKTINNENVFNISYLEEKDHIGNQKYIRSDIDIELKNSNTLSFSTKRNLLTSSAEFYNLSYNYINDCLKAGLVFRREFYTDRDIEPENSLMFKISILPFGDFGKVGLDQ